MSRTALIAAAFFGATAVVLGALAAHYLPTKLEADKVASFSTGVRFQMYHALALLALGAATAKLQLTGARWVMWGWILGTVLFSWSIYVLATTTTPALRWLGPVTPIGGLLLIASWVRLLIAALKLPRQ